MSKRRGDYDRFRESQAELSRDRSRSGRDIGLPPDIVDARRRGRCRKSLRRFCETYNPEAFTLGWSEDHRKAIARIEEATLLGALYALAMPRGSGKTTICRMAALWAISYAHRRYVFAIGANQEKAADSLAALKTYIRFLPLYGDDFPEIAYAAQSLAGIANRASGQLADGKPTMIEWAKDRIVLPTVPPPANWPQAWPLRADGMVPTSGSVVSASGLTGDGIRGSLLTLTTGEAIRPDLVLLDDPQTNESAHSPAQNATREQLVAADVLGMAGPGQTISAVMPCTVIAPGDFIDRILDRKAHPLWRGERRRMLRSMPANLAAWEPYFELYQACAQREPPAYGESLAYYLAHRGELEAGAEASWPERKLPEEVSAVQHAMHLYFRDRRAFASEYQNDPLPLVPLDAADLVADHVAARLNRCPRGTAPEWAQRLTAFVDVQQDLLWWAVCAWGEGFTAAVADYGTWPDQRRAYYTLADAQPTIAAATGIGSLEGGLWAALTRLADLLLGRDWPTAGKGALRVERCLVDSGWGLSTELVKRFCREGSAHAAVLLPSKGMGIGASGNPMSDWARRPGERRGHNWIIQAPKPGEGRLLLFDANQWKSLLAARLRQPLGEPGAMTLFGDDARQHRMIADHCTAEFRVRTMGRGRELDEWKVKPGQDNHFWDCLVGCCVAANERGAAVPGLPASPPQERKKVSYAELYKKARGKR